MVRMKNAKALPLLMENITLTRLPFSSGWINPGHLMPCRTEEQPPHGLNRGLRRKSKKNSFIFSRSWRRGWDSNNAILLKFSQIRDLYPRVYPHSRPSSGAAPGEPARANVVLVKFLGRPAQRLGT